MRVKRLEIAGFKSFAERTVLDFSTGLSAVIGPNGCGKSNVVDAVRWVLGEQSARTLRGKNMEDVIFNGSEQRKPTSMAEVSIVFENQGSISSPQFSGLEEIMITRRLFRSGDSDYLINKHTCRLKDIQQLLMDTGLGNRAYAIIEQGKVAAFIQAKPEARRLWLEEAAGISRLKSQKQENQGRLDEIAVNLKIAENRLAELQKQMEHLARQSKKALEHQEIKTKIKNLDLKAASFEFQASKERISFLNQELEQKKLESLEIERQISTGTTELANLEIKLLGAEQELSEIRKKRHENQVAIGTHEGELGQLKLRIDEYQTNEKRMSADQSLLEEKTAGLEKDWQQAALLLDGAQELQQQALSRSREAASQLAKTEKEAGDIQICLEQGKDQLRDAMSKENSAANRLGDIEREARNLSRLEEQQASRIRRLEEEIAALGDSLADDEISLKRARDQLRLGEEELKNLLQTSEEDSRLLGRLRREEQGFNRRYQELVSKHDANKTSLASYDWAQVTVRDLLRAKDKPFTPLGVVAEKLNVAPGAEALAAAALAADLQALMVSDRTQAQLLRQWLTDKNYGQVRVVILEELKNQGVTPLTGTNPLNEMLSPEPGFEMLTHLWAGASQSTEENIWQAAARLAPGQVLVGNKGERLDRPGVASLGHNNMSDLLSRRTQLRQLAMERDQARSIWQEAAQARQQAETDLEDLSNDIANQRSAHQENERFFRQQEREFSINRESLEQKRRELASIVEIQEDNLARLAGFKEEAAALGRLRTQLGQEKNELEIRVEEAKEEWDLSREAEQTARQRDMEARIELEKLQSQLDQASKDSARLGRDLAENRSQLKSLDQRIAESQELQSRLVVNGRECQAALQELYAKTPPLEESSRQLENRQEELLEQKRALDEFLRQTNSRQRQAETEAQKVEANMTQLEFEKQTLCQQIEERYLLDLGQSYQEYLSPAPEFVLSAAIEELQKLRAQFNRLGPVNLEAISDFENLKNEKAILLEQKTDAENSLADIHKLVREINHSSRKQFLATMEEVNQQLSKVFPVLMGGGSARLVMNQDTDPLEAGLNILVELPGKKVKYLEAMSGGETTLIAIAVLFALFLIRPAPFCILDEVDAPLDEANVDRFQNLLRQLTRHSHVLLITHNRRTIEMMDMLYGLTMQEKGVSKMLAISINDIDTYVETPPDRSIVAAA